MQAFPSTGAGATTSKSCSAPTSSSSSSDGVSTYSPSSAEEYWQVFSTSYGPTKTLADSLDDDRREEFHQTWVDFFEQNYPGNGGIAHAREYLLVLGTRR